MQGCAQHEQILGKVDRRVRWEMQLEAPGFEKVDALDGQRHLVGL